MSRLRYVKGNVVEITGGNYKVYSEDNIEIHSGDKIIQSGEEKGVSFGKPKSPPAPKIIPKCVVEFRPLGKWNGEYGFDWLRTGDTGQKGDTWFGGITGKYFEKDNVTIFKDSNSWNNNFHKDLKMYDILLKSYKCLNITWKDYCDGKKKKKVPYLYPIPTLTILKGKSATLNFKIEIKEVPKKLTLEFKDPKASEYITSNISEIGDIKKGKYEKFDYLKINCIKSFDTEQLLYVKADGEICGALKLHPNSLSYRKNINVVFVKVRTDINSAVVTGTPKSGSKNFFNQCFNQALIIPNTVIEPIELDCTGNFLYNKFSNKFCEKKAGKYYFAKSDGLKEYLESELKDQFNNKYKGYYTMFFIGDDYPSFDKSGNVVGNINGFSYFKSTFGVYFNGHNASTLAHETMHALELAHTFDGISKTAKYTYEAGKTNNLMDYSHWAKFGSIKRMSLFLWQWKILNPTIKS